MAETNCPECERLRSLNAELLQALRWLVADDAPTWSENAKRAAAAHDAILKAEAAQEAAGEAADRRQGD